MPSLYDPELPRLSKQALQLVRHSDREIKCSGNFTYVYEELRRAWAMVHVGGRASAMAEVYGTVCRPSKRPPTKIIIF
jgi:hypothetical protein